MKHLRLTQMSMVLPSDDVRVMGATEVMQDLHELFATAIGIGRSAPPLSVRVGRDLCRKRSQSLAVRG